MTNPANCPHNNILQNLDTKDYYCEDCGDVVPAPQLPPAVEAPAAVEAPTNGA